MAAGEAQIESTVTGNTSTQLVSDKEAALKDQSQVYLPINNALSNVGYVFMASLFHIQYIQVHSTKDVLIAVPFVLIFQQARPRILAGTRSGHSTHCIKSRELD